MLRIGTVADTTGPTSATIRYYEEIGLLTPKRASNGYRLYETGDVERLRFIVQARALNFNLEEIEEILRIREQNQTPCAYVLGQIKQKIEEIEQRIAALQQMNRESRQLCAVADQVALTRVEAPNAVCRLIEHHPSHSMPGLR